MGLNGETRKCQNIETYDYCKTNLHADNLRKECGCLPLSLRFLEEVQYFYQQVPTGHSSSFSKLVLFESPLELLNSLGLSLKLSLNALASVCTFSNSAPPDLRPLNQ